MLLSQKLALRVSEIRQRLNLIAGLQGDDLTEEIRSESDALGTEFRDVETKWRASLIAESASSDRSQFDGEASEPRGAALARECWPDRLKRAREPLDGRR